MALHVRATSARAEHILGSQLTPYHCSACRTVWLLTAWHPEEVCTEKGYSADRATHVPLQVLHP